VLPAIGGTDASGGTGLDLLPGTSSGSSGSSSSGGSPLSMLQTVAGGGS